MAKKEESCNCPMCGANGMKAHGIAKIILGLLVLANAYYSVLSWPVFIGALIVLMGVAKLMHRCK